MKEGVGRALGMVTDGDSGPRGTNDGCGGGEPGAGAETPVEAAFDPPSPEGCRVGEIVPTGTNTEGDVCVVAGGDPVPTFV